MWHQSAASAPPPRHLRRRGKSLHGRSGRPRARLNGYQSFKHRWCGGFGLRVAREGRRGRAAREEKGGGTRSAHSPHRPTNIKADAGKKQALKRFAGLKDHAVSDLVQKMRPNRLASCLLEMLLNQNSFSSGAGTYWSQIQRLVLFQIHIYCTRLNFIQCNLVCNLILHTDSTCITKISTILTKISTIDL
jgi:hypothetical protein